MTRLVRIVLASVLGPRLLSPAPPPPPHPKREGAYVHGAPGQDRFISSAASNACAGIKTVVQEMALANFVLKVLACQFAGWFVLGHDLFFLQRRE